MGKLFKYEFQKSRFMILIIAIVIGILEVLYLIGYAGLQATDMDSTINTVFSSIWLLSALFLFIAACCSLLLGILYSVLLFFNDIRKKSGYMLILTPTPTWKWILSKVLMGLFATAILVFGFVLLGAIDIGLVLQDLDTGSITGRILLPLWEAFQENAGAVLLFLLNIILELGTNILTIYLAIAMARTLLGSKKIGTFVAFVFWIALVLLQSAIANLMNLISNGLFQVTADITNQMDLVYNIDVSIPFLLMSMGLNIIFAGICYGVTVYLTDKKMSF